MDATNAARPYAKIGQRILAVVAIGFGFATIASGGRVLAGVDPGYIVFLPLLIYNTTMGIAYVSAGVMTWRSLDWGKYAAAAILALNLLVFGTIGYLYTAGSAIAADSIRAMTFRTSVWLLLFLGLSWLGRGRHPSGT